jgi:hypothetical protein|nr:MAG TPA: hypothetical protein [Caudoviricetes sp.]
MYRGKKHRNIEKRKIVVYIEDDNYECRLIRRWLNYIAEHIVEYRQPDSRTIAFKSKNRKFNRYPILYVEETADDGYVRRGYIASGARPIAEYLIKI